MTRDSLLALSLKSGLCELSITCHLMHSPLSQTLLHNRVLASNRPSEVKSLSCVRLFATHRLEPTRSPVHGIFQARVLEWVAISFSKGSFRPRDRTQISRVVGRHFTVWATREALARGLNLIKKTNCGTMWGFRDIVDHSVCFDTVWWIGEEWRRKRGEVTWK